MRAHAGQLAARCRPHEYHAGISAADAAAQPAAPPSRSLAAGCDDGCTASLHLRSAGGIAGKDFICATSADAIFAPRGDGATP